VDSIVTDPPYELGFMGKKWDNSGIAYSVELWTQCLRVLKPGGHLLSFGGTRTWHRVAVAIEDAGFEVRDSIAWMYGSGFPKSLDVSKAIDKAARAERQVIGTYQSPEGTSGGKGRKFIHAGTPLDGLPVITAPATPEAQQWEGWGTALKPAFEPIVVARKPLIGTVAENVLTHGTGGLNIDGSRIQAQDAPEGRSRHGGGIVGNGTSFELPDSQSSSPAGRWPANVILDEYSAELLDEQSGNLKSGKLNTESTKTSIFGNATTQRSGTYEATVGGASRFFYVAKASKRDRNEGLEDLDERQSVGGGGGVGDYLDDVNSASGKFGSEKAPAKNFHPTVKPSQLMRYLVKLITPPGGVVLDPFTGSGSTGKAAILEGFRFIGCELTEHYIPIIQGRLDHAEEQVRLAEEKKDEALF
jgi:site-specific DNA-methyltransferase (adenine-specific)